jgi:hypothetical protein
MSAMEIPSDHGIALAWLQCGRPCASGARVVTARVTVLEPVNSGESARYLRHVPNLGETFDKGNSSGTRFISLSASSYST